MNYVRHMDLALNIMIHIQHLPGSQDRLRISLDVFRDVLSPSLQNSIGPEYKPRSIPLTSSPILQNIHFTLQIVRIDTRSLNIQNKTECLQMSVLLITYSSTNDATFLCVHIYIYIYIYTRNFRPVSKSYIRAV